jgi:hypothetical protein
VLENEKEEEKERRLEELMLHLEEEKQNFGGFFDMIQWSLETTKSKNDTDWERASEILQKVIGLYDQN